MNKAEFMDKLKGQLQEWDDDIDQLRLKMKDLGDDAKVEYEERMVDLQEKRDAAQVKFNEIAEAGEEKWTDFKEDAEVVFDNMRSKAKALFSRFTD